MALGFWRRVAPVALLVGGVACAEELEGPEPVVAPPAVDAEVLPADPGIVCRDQLTTEVTLNGEGFSPIPIDIPDAPMLALPDIELSRGHELDGAEVTEPELIIWSGDPDADPTNAFTVDGETPRIFWKSQREMSFVIDQELTLDEEGNTGMLPEGVYDVTVGNSNGSMATTPSALAVVERPEVADFSPGITCLDQGARTIDFDGRTFLRNGSDQILLEVDGVDAPFPVALDDCTDVAHEGIDAAFCDALSVELDESSVEVGFPGLTLRNPETAACATTEDLKLRVVPPPAIDRVVPPMGCVAEESRTFTIEGAEFLRIDGQTPHVSLGSTDFTVDAMGGCESVETQGHEVERCTSLTITVDQNELAPDLYELTVVNPDPAGCDNVATGALRIVPPPSIDVISPALVCLADSERVLNVDGSDYLIVDGEIPEVTVDGEALEVDAISPESCEDLEVDGLSVQKCARLVVTLAQDGVSLGMGDLAMPLIGVRNPDPAGCSDATSSLLSVIDRPTASDLDPGILCLAQADRTLTVAGQTLLRHDTREPVLEVEGVTDPFPVTVSDCTAIEQPDLDAALCDTGTVTLPMASVADGFPALTVLNPQDAGCRSVDDRKLRLVPPPSITRVVEPMGCLAEGARQFVIEGTDFLRVDDVPPAVTVGTVGFAVDAMAGCSALETQGHTVELCTSITITIADTDLAPELYAVTVENPAPAGCNNVATGALRLVPPPDITDVEPALICLDDGMRDITITGTDFLVVDGVVPTVSVEGSALGAGAVMAPAGDCADLEVAGLAVQRCTTLVATVPQDGASVGRPDVAVTNPQPAGCTDTRNDLLEVIGGPTITSAAPALVCTEDQARDVVISGTGFLRVDTVPSSTAVLPGVEIDGNPVDAADVAISDCAGAVEINGLSYESCTTLTATVRSSLSAGRPAVVVTNPDPVGCTISDSTVLTVPPLLSVSSLPNVCGTSSDTAHPFTLSGQGFLDTGSDPTVRIRVDETPTWVEVTPTLSDCTELTVAGQTGIQTCDTIDFTFDVTQLALGMGDTYPIEVINGHVDTADLQCPLTTQVDLSVVDPPTLTSAEIISGATLSNDVCNADAFVLQVDGTMFAPGLEVSLDNGSDPPTVGTVTSFSETQLEVSFSSGLTYDPDTPSNNVYALHVENAGGCQASDLPSAVTVHSIPLVFFIDPPVVYNGFPLDVTVFSTGLASAGLEEIVLDDPDDGEPPVILCDTIAGGAVPDCVVERADRNVATVPSGTLAGTYDLEVTSTVGCSGTIVDGLDVVDATTITVTGVEPSFVSANVPTAVTIDGAGFSTTGGLPRAYISPQMGGGTAKALKAVEFQSDMRLTAIVPGGLDAGDYNLFVINADGGVGVFSTVTVLDPGSEPPVVTSITPATIDESPENLVLTGEHFDNTGDALTVDFDCTDGVSITEQASGTVNTVTSTSIDVTLTASLSQDLICEVTVTNADGSSFVYASISTKNSSGNLASFQTSSATGLTPRRALALVAARPTATSRFLYAMGGDDGTFLGAMSSVQSIGVGTDGQLIGDWADQPAQGQLPEARTNAGYTRIGRFIYLTGGHDGTVDGGMGETNGAMDTVYRAQVLDPLDTPEVADLDVALGDEAGTTGLEAGLWQYRVAAVFPSSDGSNPSGESIGGELLNVQIPDPDTGFPDQKLELIVRWSAIAGASGYRVYRSPAVVDPSGPGTLELLFDLDCSTPAMPNLDNCSCEPTLSCRDAGDTTNSSSSPLETGALGMWHEVLPLTTEREGHVTAALRHPNPALTSTGGTPAQNYETWILYAAGGRDNGSPSINYLDDYEWVAIRVFEDGHQEVQDPGGGAWTVVGSSSIGTGRADLAAWVLTETDSAFIPANHVYLALGTGFVDASNNTTADVRAGYLNASSTDGQLDVDGSDPVLDAWTGNESRGAACFGDAGGRVYLFGGQNSSGGFQGDVASALRSGPDTSPSWSAGGGGVLNPRRTYCAAAQESAFFFIAGGLVDSDPDFVAGTVQTTVQ